MLGALWNCVALWLLQGISRNLCGPWLAAAYQKNDTRPSRLQVKSRRPPTRPATSWPRSAEHRHQRQRKVQSTPHPSTTLSISESCKTFFIPIQHNYCLVIRYLYRKKYTRSWCGFVSQKVWKINKPLQQTHHHLKCPLVLHSLKQEIQN